MLPTYCAPAQPRHRLKGRPRSTMDCRHQSLGSRTLWQRPHLRSCRSSPRMCRGTQHPAGRVETVVKVLPASGVTRGAGPYLSGTAALARLCGRRLSARSVRPRGANERTDIIKKTQHKLGKRRINSKSFPLALSLALPLAPTRARCCRSTTCSRCCSSSATSTASSSAARARPTCSRSSSTEASRTRVSSITERGIFCHL